MNAQTTALIVFGGVIALYVFKKYQENERAKATADGWNSLISVGGKLAGFFL